MATTFKPYVASKRQASAFRHNKFSKKSGMSPQEEKESAARIGMIEQLQLEREIALRNLRMEEYKDLEMSRADSIFLSQKEKNFPGSDYLDDADSPAGSKEGVESVPSQNYKFFNKEMDSVIKSINKDIE